MREVREVVERDMRCISLNWTSRTRLWDGWENICMIMTAARKGSCERRTIGRGSGAHALFRLNRPPKLSRGWFDREFITVPDPRSWPCNQSLFGFCLPLAALRAILRQFLTSPTQVGREIKSENIGIGTCCFLPKFACPGIPTKYLMPERFMWKEGRYNGEVARNHFAEHRATREKGRQLYYGNHIEICYRKVYVGTINEWRMGSAPIYI